MKVKELIEHLSKLDQDLEVFTSVDDEGNGYNSLYYAPSTGYVDPRDLTAGGYTDTFYFEDTVECDYGFSPKELKSFIKAVCL